MSRWTGSRVVEGNGYVTALAAADHADAHGSGTNQAWVEGLQVREGLRGKGVARERLLRRAGR